MPRVVLAGLRARTARLVLTALAIALGVAFVTGSMVLEAAVGAGLRDGLVKDARGVDASVTTASGPGRKAPLDETTLAAVRGAPGVAAAHGRQLAVAPLVDAKGKAVESVAVVLPADEGLRPFDLVTGRYPGNADEIVLDERTARHTPGPQVTVLDALGGHRTFTVVGTIHQPAAASGEVARGDWLVVLPETMALLAPDRGYSQIVVRAGPGVSQQEVTRSVEAAVGRSDVTVLSGEEAIAALVAETAPQTMGFTRFLSSFAVLAMIVAALVIHTTFTILIAQRTEELALLRCVGASRAQVFLAVITEAVVTGLVASTLGLFGGLGASALLQAVLGGEVYAPLGVRTVVAAFAVGVLVTVVAAVLPARAATRVAPVAALRSQADGEREVARTGRVRVAFAVLLAVVGVAAPAFGGAEDIGLAGLGVVALLCSVVTLGPVLVGPVMGVLGAVPRRLFGTTAALATANATRNPRRTAATAGALVVGLTVVALVTTVAASVEETTTGELDRQFPIDYAITSLVYNRPLPQEFVDALSELDQVAVAAPRQNFNGTLGPAGAYGLSAVRGDAVGSLLRPSVLAGELDRLGPGDIALGEQLAEQTGFGVGDTIPMSSPEGSVDVRVVAVYDEGAASSGTDLGMGLVDLSVLHVLQPELVGYQGVLVKLKPGVDEAAGRAAVDGVVATSPLAASESASDVKDRLADSLRKTLVLLWALIGLAVLIAMAGIANTLSLSVLERTGESALLRALGLTRGQLRATLTVEAALIAAMGAVIGVALGIGSGWLLTRAMSTEAMPMRFVVPYAQVTTMLLLAMLVAPLAAVGPAWRAARLPITAGLARL